MKDYYLNRQQPINTGWSRRKKITVALTTIGLIASALAIWWFLLKADTPDSTQQTTPTKVTQQEPEESTPETPPLPNLQPVIDTWVTSAGGSVSVKITDTTGKQLASHNAAKTYFTASIYKLFVAYAGYQKIDDGIYSPNDPYLSGYTRGKCLDAMIRDSYSPCAEKMWAELGKATLTDKMKSYGLKNTSLTGLQTTAEDTAIILNNIATGKDLKPASQKKFLDSMKTQDSLYRRGLPSGFKSLVVYNKVGWNLSQEWHDTAIVETKDGQKVIVSVLTSGVGFRSISALGTELEKALQ